MSVADGMKIAQHYGKYKAKHLEESNKKFILMKKFKMKQKNVDSMII